MVNLNQIMAGTFSNTTTIAVGATTSGNVPCGNLALIGIKVPSINSSGITLNVSSDQGATWQPMYLDNANNNSNAQYSVLSSGGAESQGNVYVGMNPDYMLGADYLQLVMSNGLSASFAPATFTLHFREKR
jgi:hypothetical protein